MSAIAISNAARWLLVLSEVVYANWDQISRLFDRAEEAAADVYGYYLSCVFEMRDSVSGAWTERGSFGTHWVNTTGGDLDDTWTNADFAAVEAGASAFWTASAGRIPTTFRLVEFRWYAFGPGVTGENPAYRVTPITAIPGTASGATARQLACSYTLKTPLRKHWGRFYLPLAASVLDAAGRLGTSTFPQSYADTAKTFLNAGSGQGVYPCVWDRVRKGALGVTAVQVDDIPDIIRRRRPNVTQIRGVAPLP